MYSITLDRRLSRLTLVFSGHMDQDPAAFLAEFTDAAQTIRNAPGVLGGMWDLLADYADTPVMPQDRAQNTARIFEWCLANNLRRAAGVMNSATQRMQMHRLTKRNDRIGFFETRSAAQDWLNSEE